MRSLTHQAIQESHVLIMYLLLSGLLLVRICTFFFCLWWFINYSSWWIASFCLYDQWTCVSVRTAPWLPESTTRVSNCVIYFVIRSISLWYIPSIIASSINASAFMHNVIHLLEQNPIFTFNFSCTLYTINIMMMVLPSSISSFFLLMDLRYV